MMSGQIDWAGIEVIMEIYGITDPEQFIEDLMVIKSHIQDVQEAQSRARS